MLIRFQINKEENISNGVLFKDESKKYNYVFNIIDVNPEFSKFLSNLNRYPSIDLISINFIDKKVYMGRLNRSRVSNDVFSFVFKPTGGTYVQRISKDISFFRFGLGEKTFISDISNIDELFVKSIAILSKRFEEIDNLK